MAQNSASPTSTNGIGERSLDNVPDDLLEYDQHLVWSEEERDGDPTKVPYQPSGDYAKTNDPSTWTDFKTALEAVEDGQFDGIGFAFTEGDPFVGIDIDDCVEDGELSDVARRTVDFFDSYAELSPSGTGIHILIKGSIPGDRNRTDDIPGTKEVEIYDSGRYFTMTGRTLDGIPDAIEERQDDLNEFYEWAFGEDEEEESSPSTAPEEPVNLDDRELLEKARNAANGPKFERLWNGDTSGHESHSEADLALCGMLAFWTGGDRDRIDRLFRQSGLCREKWTERPDYRRRTIDKVLSGKTEFYDPSGADSKKRRNGRDSSSEEESGSGPRTRVFWYVDEEEEKVKIDRSKLLSFLEDQGFGKFYYESDLESKFVYVEDNVVQRVSTERIRDFALEYVRSIPDEEGLPLDGGGSSARFHPGYDREDVEDALLRGANVYLSESLLKYLSPLDLDFHRDTPDAAFFYYRNGFVRVTAEGYELRPYSELDGVIWKDQIIDRDFVDLSGVDDRSDWVWNQHLWNVAGGDRDRHASICSALGYLQHSYKDPAVTKAVALMDEKVADVEEGRTGKSLTAKGLQETCAVKRIDGRNFTFRQNFTFQQVDPDTQIVDYNDIREHFPFSKLFSAITDDLEVEDKGEAPYTIPFKDSPKFLLSTNYVVEGQGASFEDRIHQVEFSSYYGTDHTPEDEFKHRLFSDWGEEEWARFDNTMMACVQLYLDSGLIDYEHRNLRYRKLRQETSPDFADWFRDVIELGERKEKKALWRSFKEEFEPDYQDLTSYKFTTWVKTFARIYGLDVDEPKSGSTYYIVLRSGGDS